VLVYWPLKRLGKVKSSLTTITKQNTILTIAIIAILSLSIFARQSSIPLQQMVFAEESKSGSGSSSGSSSGGSDSDSGSHSCDTESKTKSDSDSNNNDEPKEKDQNQQTNNKKNNKA